MFGIDYGSMTIKNGKGQILINEFQIVIKEYAVKQVFNPFRFLFFWNKEVQRAKIASNEIEKSQIELLQNYRLNKTSDEISKDQSILGHLVRTPYVSEKERCADMTVFMMAGHDSTSNTISWIIVEVSKNKKILQKIQSEINNKINKNDRIITPKILNELSYLEDVIKEGSRLWPVSALGTMRTCSKDRIYKNYIIPKGSILWMPFYAIFRYGIQVIKYLILNFQYIQFLNNNNKSSLSLPLSFSLSPWCMLINVPLKVYMHHCCHTPAISLSRSLYFSLSPSLSFYLNLSLCVRGVC